MLVERDGVGSDLVVHERHVVGLKERLVQPGSRCLVDRSAESTNGMRRRY